jgi:hypothetical protein
MKRTIMMILAAGLFAVTAHAQSKAEIHNMSDHEFYQLMGRFFTDAIDADGAHTTVKVQKKVTDGLRLMEVIKQLNAF